MDLAFKKSSIVNSKLEDLDHIRMWRLAKLGVC